jgi:hypothetical protein
MGIQDGEKPFNTFDFAIEPAVRDGNKACIPPAHGAGSVPGFLS